MQKIKVLGKMDVIVFGKYNLEKNEIFVMFDPAEQLYYICSWDGEDYTEMGGPKASLDMILDDAKWVITA